MKKKFIFLFIFIFIFVLLSCSKEIKDDEYVIKDVNVYREAKKIDKSIPIMFYKDSEHVPFISVELFYKEFYKMDLIKEKNNNRNIIKYLNKDNGYLKFDTDENLIYIYKLDSFSDNPDFKEDIKKKFYNLIDVNSTKYNEKIISLKNYGLDIYGWDEVYVPLNLLNIFSGGVVAYNIAYNGADIFVLDDMAEITSYARDYAYYGDDYTKIINDLDTPRYSDMANYAYGLMCLEFDNFRGYTTNLGIGDNNLLTLGLDQVLEKYYPKVKEYLLSTDKLKYYQGYISLIAGMCDGGHTAFSMSSVDVLNNVEDLILDDDELMEIYDYLINDMDNIVINSAIYSIAKKEVYPDYENQSYNFLYKFDEETKTALISFDNFIVDYDGWDNYYKTGLEEDIPLNTDTYAFVRSCLYKALEDEAEIVLLDLTTNGGGDTGALIGIVGLLNESKSTFSMTNVVDKNKKSRNYGIDINIDGKYDELDKVEAKKFDFNIGVLTSPNSFSCANLLPSLLQELGYKVIGQKSRGGSCSLSLSSTADGLICYHSSYECLFNEKGENIDNGVELDLELPIIISEDIYNPSGYDVTNVYNLKEIYDYFKSLKEE